MGVITKNIWRSYSGSFAFLARHWKLVGLIYLAQLLFAFIAIAPLNGLLEHAFGESLNLSEIAGAFNYTYIMEFLREYNVAFNSFLDHSLLIMLLYICWSIFLNGGIARSLFVSASDWTLSQFWRHCGQYFSKFLVLHVYVFVLMGLVTFVVFRIFMKDGINPFSFETEQVLINRFWILIVLLAFLLFVLQLFKDITKILIVGDRAGGLHQDMIKALRRFFSLEIVALAVMHLLLLIVVSGLYFALRKNAILVSWTMIGAGQLYLLIRIAYRILRLSAFKHQLEGDLIIDCKTG